ncbi:MAG: putative bifunctional diguanylate cyclase/phosphodiesterase [Xanthobacteraceae bacterium]
MAPGPPVDSDRGKAATLSGRLPQFRDQSGHRGNGHTRPVRPAAGLRVIAALALVLVMAFLICAALGLVFAGRADDRLEAEQRQSLTRAVGAHLFLSPGLSPADQTLISTLGLAAGVNDLRLEAGPAAGERVVQSALDRNGRIVGWFNWEPRRPATAMVLQLLPMASLLAFGFVGFSALAMWQLGRLGRRVQRLESEDPLTGLPNHNHFFQTFDDMLVARGDETLAYLSVDLDGFNEINDSLGYMAGDVVLAEIGRRLREAVPPTSVIGRLGSDEFAILVPSLDPEAALPLAHAVRQIVARPIWANQAVHVVCSIGCAIAPRDGSSREELSRRAELALQAAKRRGRGSAVVFSADMEADLQERRFIKREVARALAARGFELHYQPIVAADSGAVVGVEALLRWNHPTRGMIAPSVFIPVAEEAGLMDQLGEFVLRRALADAERWPGLYVSVNLSPLQVRDPGFIDFVASVLAEREFARTRLVLEVTEGVLIDDPDETRTRLLALRALGVRLALDDFGSGYSNLSYLQQLPFDKLKIDRSFVTSLDKSANGGVIVQAVVALGRALGMDVVVEGVETEEQRVLLRLAGCNEMQGYLFARPGPAADIGRFLSGAIPAGEDGRRVAAGTAGT